jgi:hypothetical protein
MPKMYKRSWDLPNGGNWESWRVEWRDGAEQVNRRVFDNWADAQIFFVELAVALRSAAAPLQLTESR